MREARKKALLKVRRRMAFTAAILGLGFMVEGLLLAGREGEEYRSGSKLYESVEADCVIRETEGICENRKSNRQEPEITESLQHRDIHDEEEKAEEKSNTGRISEVDFQALWAINPEVAAWIEIPGTRVSYPVLFRYGDTDFYLTHRIDKREGKQGAIHIDGAGPDGIESQNILIYGHNLLDSSMFSSLHAYKRESFYQEYPYVYLHMPDGTKRTYRIAGCMLTRGTENEWYRYEFEDAASAQEYYDCFQQESLYDTKTKLNAEEGRQTLLLSTCYRRKYRRLILAVREN